MIRSVGKSLLVAGVGLGLASGASAQSDGRGASFGVLGGATFSTIKGSDVAAQNLTTRTSFAAGAFVQLGISRNFAIEPQLLYIIKGAKGSQPGVEFGARLSYVEVPVLATVKFPAGTSSGPVLFLQAGPALAVKVDCELTGSAGGTMISSKCQDITPDPVQIKSTDLSFIVGAGVDVRRARIMARYELGLSKIDDSSAGSNAKNRSLVVLVGWTIKSPR